MPKMHKASYILGRTFASAVLCAALITPTIFCWAQANVNSTQTQNQTNPATQTQKQYYLVTVVWDSSSNALSQKNGTIPQLTTASFTKDTGTGSQFYAMIMNSQGLYAINSKKDVFKFYLGKWELPSGQKQGDIKITVPYLATGAKLIIVDAKTDKPVLQADVSKLAHPATASAAKKTTAVVAPAKSATSQTSASSGLLVWVIIIIIILILAAGGYFFWRWKKRKVQQVNDPMQPKI